MAVQTFLDSVSNQFEYRRRKESLTLHCYEYIVTILRGEQLLQVHEIRTRRKFELIFPAVALLYERYLFDGKANETEPKMADISSTRNS